MSIARRSHGKSAHLGVFECVTIIAAQSGGGVEHFQGVRGQGLERGESDSSAKHVVGMGRDGEPTAFMNHVARIEGRFPLEKGKRRPDAKKMSFSGRDFDAGNNEKIIDG